jgi:hypothetical protein
MIMTAATTAAQNHCRAATSGTTQIIPTKGTKISGVKTRPANGG